MARLSVHGGGAACSERRGHDAGDVPQLRLSHQPRRAAVVRGSIHAPDAADTARAVDVRRRVPERRHVRLRLPPASAELEKCFADVAAEVAKTVEMAIAAGLAGCSIEDLTRRPDEPIYDMALATERVAAAAAAAHAGPGHLVLTARAENYLHGRPDLSDTISRLQAYQEAGADVLFAPRTVDVAEIRSLLHSADRPGNVLPFRGASSVGALGAAGV